MRLHIIVSPFYAANCIIAVPQEGAEALVIDPSGGIVDKIRALLDSQGVTVGAVLATHGHPDHVWDCADVASWKKGGPATTWIPGPDRYRMDDPMAHIGMSAPFDVGQWHKPEVLEDFPAGSFEVIDGLWMKMIPAPGHTEGSAFFIGHCDIEILVDGTVIASSPTPVPWALSGDVLFAGSVGRTDLPGGDETQMRHSLRTISNALDPATLLLPGHGPLTRLADEIETNPYLRRARRIG